MPVGAARLVG